MSMSQEGAESDEDLSDDELPPDVDLSDPFFAEELNATGTFDFTTFFNHFKII